jgi:hypothetical protein
VVDDVNVVALMLLLTAESDVQTSPRMRMSCVLSMIR